MSFIALPIALAFPLLEGLLFLALLERKVRILSHLERWCAALFLGLPISSFVLFFATLLGLPLTRMGFLIGHIVIIALLALALWRWARPKSFTELLFPSRPPRSASSAESLRM